MKPLADCHLYTFVDTGYLDGRDAGVLAKSLCRGGADIVQLRAKGLAEEAIRPIATTIAEIAADMGVWFVLNDHWELAVELGFPAVHLGQEDVLEKGWVSCASRNGGVEEVLVPTTAAPPTEGRPALGLSSHAPDQARLAEALGADYIAVGPVYPTDTKPGRPAVTLDYVRWAGAELTRPWFAIGGIHLGNVDAVLEAGATRVCVVSAILTQSDVTAACREFRARLPA